MYTPLDKKLIGNQDKLPEALKAKIEAAPESPAKMSYDNPVKQAMIDPMTGMPVQEMTNVPPQQANTLGTAKPVFKPQAQVVAEKMYGGIEERQNSVFATPMFKKNCNKKY